MHKGRAYWDRHAQGYAIILRLLQVPMPRAVQLVARELNGAGRVLEVGAGTGAFTRVLAACANEVVATDYSPSMLCELEKSVRRHGLRNVSCEYADIATLNYPPQSFDAVVAANVLHLVPDFGSTIATLRRVLVPGGRIVVPTFCHSENVLSRFVSRLFSWTGFPACRSFTAETLREALTNQGVMPNQSELVHGLIPIAFISGSFDSQPTPWARSPKLQFVSCPHCRNTSCAGGH